MRKKIIQMKNNKRVEKLVDKFREEVSLINIEIGELTKHKYYYGGGYFLNRKLTLHYDIKNVEQRDINLYFKLEKTDSFIYFNLVTDPLFKENAYAPRGKALSEILRTLLKQEAERINKKFEIQSPDINKESFNFNAYTGSISDWACAKYDYHFFQKTPEMINKQNEALLETFRSAAMVCGIICNFASDAETDSYAKHSGLLNKFENTKKELEQKEKDLQTCYDNSLDALARDVSAKYAKEAS
jgi:hypothetical protein